MDWSIDDLTSRVAGAAAEGRFDEETPIWFRVPFHRRPDLARAA